MSEINVGSDPAMIEIVSYDCTWPALFEAEAAEIRKAMRGLALRVEHVGSTSVPGLAAKRVIDIQVSVETLEMLDIYSKLLAPLGYAYIPLGEFDAVYPFFQKPGGSTAGTHHVHLCVLGGQQERRHLAFRDYLREHPSVALQYLELKRSLAAAHDGATLESRECYSLSKTEFISSVLGHGLATNPR